MRVATRDDGAAADRAEAELSLPGLRRCTFTYVCHGDAC